MHIAEFPTVSSLDRLVDARLQEEWARLVELRDRVLARIEPLRKSKQIGSSLQAKVTLWATGAERAWLESHARDLPMLFIVSDVELRSAASDADTEAAPRITIERASGIKCERCWRYVPWVSDEAPSAGLCARCIGALGLTTPYADLQVGPQPRP